TPGQEGGLVPADSDGIWGRLGIDRHPDLQSNRAQRVPVRLLDLGSHPGSSGRGLRPVVARAETRRDARRCAGGRAPGGQRLDPDGNGEHTRVLVAVCDVYTGWDWRTDGHRAA